MLLLRFVVLSSLKIALLSSCVSAFAQVIPGQWAGEQYLVDCRYLRNSSSTSAFIDEKGNIQKAIPKLESLLNSISSSGYFNEPWCSYWRNDALYAVAYGRREKNEDGTRFKRWTFAKWRDDEWNFVGDYKTDTSESLTAIPCDNDRFLVVSCNKDMTNDDRPDRSPFHLMSISPGKTELRLDSSIDHGQDDIRKYMSTPACFELASYSDVIMTDGYAVLVHRHTGLYWIFSLENASLKKAGNIFKSVTPEMIAKGGFTRAVLCVNPEKAGTILVAAQEEDFFITETGDAFREAKEYKENFPYATDEDVEKIFELRWKAIVDRNPFIAWYRIYPESGKVERLSQPPEGGTNLRGDEGKNDIWRPMPDGSVKMGWTENYIDLSVKKPKKADTKDGSGGK
jgi:hypothetical protein